tara:strand:+ start:501 stop:746 length:246 start_codon:yes stop_codon:yes gene_type:complete
MLIQTKRLKDALKLIDAKNREGKTPSVKVDRKYIGSGQYEYGYAVSVCAALTKKQVSDLQAISQYFDIYNNIERNFSVIQY